MGCSRYCPENASSNGSKANRGFWGLHASFDHGPNVELSPTKSLGEEFAGAQLIALFVRRFRRGITSSAAG
jgi:hypothetical protein